MVTSYYIESLTFEGTITPRGYLNHEKLKISLHWDGRLRLEGSIVRLF